VQVGSAEEHDATPTTKEESVDDEDDGLRGEYLGWRFVFLELVSNPGNTFAELPTQLPKCLFAPDVRIPKKRPD
jgi:hypothetical protein